MKEAVVGIRREELGSLSIEVSEYADRISEIFGRINVIMDRLPNCYKSPASAKLRTRYRELSNNYPLLKENVTSYSDDFAAIVRKIQEGDKALAKMFNEFTEEVMGKTRAVDPRQLLNDKLK